MKIRLFGSGEAGRGVRFIVGPYGLGLIQLIHFDTKSMAFGVEVLDDLLKRSSRFGAFLSVFLQSVKDFSLLS
ncbi:hypothetical protein RRF57_012028 [Xylaria bambusicola]|uniref:Uncharacterized protein n=1 Tax=Xylaria bambusicola TaxID=326684 RepID=A0AAN7V193_9PEZI